MAQNNRVSISVAAFGGVNVVCGYSHSPMKGCALPYPELRLDKFSIADALRLRACISDFLAFCYGDQGRDAGLTNAEKTWLAGAVGKIKYLSDALVYGGGR